MNWSFLGVWAIDSGFAWFDIKLVTLTWKVWIENIYLKSILFFPSVYLRFISKFLWCKMHLVFFSEKLVHFRKLEPVNFWGSFIRWDIRCWFVTNWLAGSLPFQSMVKLQSFVCGWSVPGSWFMFLLQFFNIALWHNVFDYKRYFLMSLF